MMLVSCLKRLVCRPVVASQRRAVPSHAAEATCSPSGLKALAEISFGTRAVGAHNLLLITSTELTNRSMSEGTFRERHRGLRHDSTLLFGYLVHCAFLCIRDCLFRAAPATQD